jgi:4-amino-4-deoxy-L-arabinose transferase-like glycosyltransferase
VKSIFVKVLRLNFIGSTVREASAAYLILFCLCVALFAVGVGETTSLTSKDEYHRVFRTALQMVEQDSWWIPTLDGQPRLEKPPLIAWLTRLSFELFGTGVRSARMINVIFSALFVAVIA